MEAEANWIIKEVQEDLLRQVNIAPASANLSPLVRRLLAQRGLSEPEAIDRFLSPRLSDLSDPFLMPDMQLAVDRLLKAVDEKERVVIYGDYDVDGVTSVALMQEVLAKYGLECQGFLPHRMDEGYGVSKSGVERCLKDHDPQLIIAVDCGTTSIEEIAYLKERGVDVVICDHHECSQDGRPDCVALVNPKVGDDYHYLCSAGVVFKVAHALLKTRQNLALDLKNYLDMVALGTVADIVPLVSENRILVRKGLHCLRETENCGLVALKRETKLGARIQTSDIGFRLGPRLNAAGRLNTAQSALDLLLARDPAEAQNIAQKLAQQNKERQELEYRMFEEAMAMIEKGPHPSERCSIVLGSDDWHPGVVGIVASRLMRRYHRPTFIIAFDDTGLGKGSGRSVEKISLVSALNSCEDLLIKGGGHEMAAGLTIWKQNFPDFQKRFEEIVAANARSEYLIPTLYVDAEVQLTELTLSLLDSYEMMEPFGSHNPQPTMLCRNVSLAGEPNTISNKHLRLEFYQNGTIRDAVYFGAAELELPAPPWDVAFTIQRNEYRGRESLQIHVVNIRSSQ